MENLKADSSIILNYLYEKRYLHKIGFVKKTVAKQEIGDLVYNFDSGLDQLELYQFSRLWSRGEDGIISILPKGKEFIELNNARRSEIEKDFETLLWYLYPLLAENKQTAMDGEILRNDLGWSQQRFEDAGSTLKEKGFGFGYAADNKIFFNIGLTPKGRGASIGEVPLNQSRHENQPAIINYNEIRGDNNSINNLSVSNSVNSGIQANKYPAEDKRNDIYKLLERLNNELQEISAEHAEEAEAIAELAKVLVETVAKDVPNKKLVKIHMENLRKAADDVASITQKVLIPAQLIINFIQTNFNI